MNGEDFENKSWQSVGAFLPVPTALLAITPVPLTQARCSKLQPLLLGLLLPPHPHPILDPPHPRFACRSDAHFLPSDTPLRKAQRLVSAMLSRKNNANKHLITVEGRREGCREDHKRWLSSFRSMLMRNQMSKLDHIQSLAHPYTLISPRLSAGTGYGASL